MPYCQDTAKLFDMLSDNSSVDHPLCEECTDTLLLRLEQLLEQAEQDSQQYQVSPGSKLETLAVINLIKTVNQSWQKFIKLFAKFDGKAKLLSHVVKQLFFY